MKEHKVKQYIFNRTHKFEDNLENIPYSLVEGEDQIISCAVDYFSLPMPALIYPSKSYAVAIIYAHLLRKHFDDDFYESLNDKNLFCGNDKYFKPYQEVKGIYDQILDKIEYVNEFHLNLEIDQIKKTVCYFEQEFF